MHLICLFYSNTFETWREAWNKGPLVLTWGGRGCFSQVGEVAVLYFPKGHRPEWLLDGRRQAEDGMTFRKMRDWNTELGKYDSVVGEGTEEEYDTGKTNCSTPKPQVHNCEWDLLMRAVTALLLWNKCSWSKLMLCLCVHVCVCLHA